MPNINAKIDANNRPSLLGVTDDVNQFYQPLPIDAATGALKISAVITGLNWVSAEVPTPSPDGVTTNFTLVHAPVITFVTVNRLMQIENVDYTVSGTTITFLAGSIPQTGDYIYVTYAY